MKKIITLSFIFCFALVKSQTLSWSTFTDSAVTYSSPRAADLNGDGIKDIVIGAGKEGQQTNYGILALDGANGSNLWMVPARNEVFNSAQFHDITNDNIPDVFIGGRDAQFYAINGATGNIIWQFFPYPNLNPNDSGWYNFYSAQFIPDMNNDGVSDILVANGGDHAAPVWQTNRPPGHLMVLDALTGNILAKAVTPDSSETYCSPVVADVKGNGTLYVIFGTGGETLGGSMWIAELVNDLMSNNLSQAYPLVSHPAKGFIAPASLGKFSNDGSRDIIVQGYDGTVYRFNGNTFIMKWSKNFPGTESSAAPVLGNFTGNLKPDIFCVLYKGVAPSYSDYYQVMLDGSSGNVVYKDSIGSIHFVSGNAVDLNGDGRDEAIISLNNVQGSFHHQLKAINFQTNTTTNLTGNEAGSNIGSTPLIDDINNDQLLDIVYAYRADSINPMGNKGMYVKKLTTSISVPAHGLAWGSYMGTHYDGQYTTDLTDCGQGSILSAFTPINPTCNGFSNGAIIPNTSNGTPPFNFYWSNGSTDSVLLNIGAGSYYLNVIDSNGCFESATAALVDPYIITFGGLTTPSCIGSANGQITVSSSGCYCMFSGCTFSWNTGTTGYTASGLSTGTYTVTITHGSGCVVTSTVSIPDGLPVISDTLLTNVSCNGLGDGSIKLTATDPNSAMYHWNTGDSTFLINNLSPGNYSVAVSDARPCIDTLNFTITEPIALSLSVSSTPQSTGAFSDGTATAYTSGGTPPYSYLWNDSQSQTTPTASGLVFGYYSVLVTDSNGCIIIDSALVDISLFISKNDSPEEIMVYPNPAEQNSLIVFSGLSDDIQMTITDMNGRLVYEINKPETKSVIVTSQSFSKGVYNCRIINEKQVKNVKLVIN